MNGDEIEEFDDTRGIDSFVTVKACGHRVIRITEVNQGDGELALLKFLVGETIESCFSSPVDEIL